MRAVPSMVRKARELKFRPWTLWLHRGDIDGSELPGIYLLARFKCVVPKRVDPLDAEVVYVGETSGQDLNARWYQFNRSAFEGKFGHSGGKSYREKVAKTPTSLYLAALPVDFGEPLSSTFIRYIERLVLLEYVCKHGMRPICNIK